MTKASKQKKQSHETPADNPVADAAEATTLEPEVESNQETATPEPAPVKEDEAIEHRLMRLQADFDNYRRRTLREKVEWQHKANESLLLELLPVLDHYELGMKTARTQGTDETVLDGFTMIYNQFIAALAKHQVKAISAEGQPFDPNQHEAVTHVPSAEHPAGTVIAETRRGYQLNDKLLRAAQVVVSSGPAEPEDGTAPAEPTQEEATQ